MIADAVLLRYAVTIEQPSQGVPCHVFLLARAGGRIVQPHASGL